MLDLFARERELCEVSIRNRKYDNRRFEYNISNRAVEILVFYKNKKDWNVKNGRNDVDRLWKNFNLAFIGYTSKCVVLDYEREGFFVKEYLFPMCFFNIDNFHSPEFQQYDPNY